jgi:hypothetical protein
VNFGDPDLKLALKETSGCTNHSLGAVNSGNMGDYYYELKY